MTQNSRAQIMLLDNNFLASPRWEAKLEFLLDHRLKVNFHQGLDICLIDDRKAALLAPTQTFKSRRLHFAWDRLGDETAVRKGVEILEAQGIKPYRLMFYLLCGFNTRLAEDEHRFQVLRELGCDPFVMLYHRRDRRLNHFARWVNRRIYKVCDFPDYRPHQARLATRSFPAGRKAL